MAPRVYAQFRVEARLSGDYVSVVEADAPTGYWPLEDESGTTAVDDSGNSHTGTYAGGVTLGQLGLLDDATKAAAFDGVDDQVTATVPALGAAFSLEILFKTTAAKEGHLVEISPSFFYIQNSPYVLKFDGGAGTRMGSVVAVNDGRRHHAAVTYDGTNGRLYLDGALVDGPAAKTWNLSGTTAYIGRYFGVDPAAFFQGTLSQPAVYNYALSASQIQGHYLATLWTDLTLDVLTEVGIHWVRGTSGHGPLDRVADPGSLEFSLRNDKGNTGKMRSWYSPNHPNARAGWTEGIAVRAMGRYNAVDYPLWRGKIVTIDPTPGDSPQRVAVVAHDSIADFTDAKVREILPQVDQTEVQLLQAVIDALPTADQPVATDFDAPLDVFPFAFGDAGAGASALGLMNDIAISAFMTLFVAGDGTLTSINRHSEATAASVLTLVDEDLLTRGPGFVGASSLQNVYSLVRVTIHPNHPDPTILFRSTAAITLGPGESVDVWDTYSNPNDRTSLIGARSFTALAAATDYTANAFADGSGTGADDLTASLTISIDPFTTTSLTHLANPTTRTMYVTLRQLRGIGIFDDDPQTLESSVTTAGKPLEVDLKFQTDPVVAKTLADYLLAQYSDRSRHGEELVFDPHRSQTLMVAALATEIGSVVTASERQTGLDEVGLLIRGIAGDIEPGPYGFALTMRYSVVPRIASTAFVFDDPVYGVFDSLAAVLGYF